MAKTVLTVGLEKMDPPPLVIEAGGVVSKGSDSEVTKTAVGGFQAADPPPSEAETEEITEATHPSLPVTMAAGLPPEADVVMAPAEAASDVRPEGEGCCQRCCRPDP